MSNQLTNPLSGRGTANALPIWINPTTLSSSSISQVAGAIASLTLTNAGTGATNGTYSQVTLTSSTGVGTGATADIVVSGNVVTVLALRAPGSGYAVGDTLSTSAIGGSGFVFTVASVVASANASGNVTAQRMGAGTANPRGGIDIATGAFFQTSMDVVDVIFGLPSSGTAYLVGQALQFTTAVPSNISAGFGVSNYCFVDASARSSTTTFYGHRISVSTQNTSVTCNTYGIYSTSSRSSATDTATSSSVYGVVAGASVQSTVGSASTATAQTFWGLFSHNAPSHTITNGTGVYLQPTNAGTITTFAAFDQIGFASSGTIGTYYGLRIRATTTQTITNRWLLSLEDPAGKSAHYGNLGVGNALDVGAGKIIASLTLTNAGTGATNGTYSQVALTGGSGTGATADIVVSGNVVTVLVLRAPGQGYAVGDTLSTAAIGGSGFVFTVASVASILRSDGQVVAPRLGGGTTSPKATIHSAGGVLADGFDRVAIKLFSTSTSASLQAGLYSIGAVSSPPTNVVGVLVGVQGDGSTGLATYGFYNAPQTATSTLGTAYSLIGTNSLVYRSYAADLSNTATITGINSVVGTISAIGATGTTTANGIVSQINNTVATHTITTAVSFQAKGDTNGTITTYYGLQLLGNAGSGTITTKWGISQEDTTANNLLAGATVIGAAAGTAPAAGSKLDVRGVIDLTAATTNGVKFAVRAGGTAPSSTTQTAYEEGTFTPTLVGWTFVTASGTWTRIGRSVTVHIQITGGTSSATGGATASLPSGLTPARPAAGAAVNTAGTALGNGVCAATTAGTIITSTAISSSSVDKVLSVTYEV